MDLRDFEAVIAVADHGTFTGAARALFVAQPALSKRIAGLEAELGTPLFERTPRGVLLSSAGEAFVARSRAIVDLAVDAREAVTSVGLRQTGRVAICALPTIINSHVVPVVSRLARAYPGITVRLLGAESARAAVAMVESGAADAGLCATPPPSHRTRSRAAFEQQLMVLLPPKTRAPRRALTAGELVRHPLVITPVGTSTRQLVDELFEHAGLLADVIVESEQRDALVPLVVAGAGITFVSERLADDAARRHGVVVRATDPPITRPIALVVRDGPPSPALQALLEIVDEGGW